MRAATAPVAAAVATQTRTSQAALLFVEVVLLALIAQRERQVLAKCKHGLAAPADSALAEGALAIGEHGERVRRERRAPVGRLARLAREEVVVRLGYGAPDNWAVLRE